MANWKAMMDDMDFEERVLTNVRLTDTYVELNWDGMGFAYERKLAPDFVPKIGMKTKVWGSFGRPVRGLIIDATVIYYRTEQEQAEQHRQWVENKRREDEIKYEAEKSQNDDRIAKLPAVFQERIAFFREYKPTWGRDFEGYELFVCEQAVLFADKLKTTDAVKAFHASTYDSQKKQIPELGEGHSGNTFGSACTLASLYLTHPELVPKMHGALCAMVGCDDYGCASIREKVAV